MVVGEGREAWKVRVTLLVHWPWTPASHHSSTESVCLASPTEPHHQRLAQFPLLSGGDTSEVGSTLVPRVPQ